MDVSALDLISLLRESCTTKYNSIPAITIKYANTFLLTVHLPIGNWYFKMVKGFGSHNGD